MIADNLTIIICSTLLVLALVTPLLNPFFRKPRKDEDIDKRSEPLPKISVVIIANDYAEGLEKHLPLYLSQNYSPGYEVVVVTDKDDTDSEAITKRYASNHNLYATFIPESSRYMSRRKLAITIGVKAAKNDWVVLTDAYCRPASENWLGKIAEECTPEHNLVIGYTKFDSVTHTFSRFKRALYECYLIRLAQLKVAFRTEGKNLAFRKSDFLRQNGYQGNLKYIYGEYDFLVNKYAQKGGTGVVTASDAWMIEDSPSKKLRKNKQLFYMETRRHLKRSFLPRLLFNTDQAVLHLNYLAIIAAGMFGGITQNWIVCGAAGLAIIITLVLRMVIARRILIRFAEPVPLWKVIPYEIALVWHNLFYWLRYVRADKYDFICHKI